MLNSNFLRSGILLSLTNVSAGVLAYIFQILMGRLLLPAEYGLFSALLSASAFLTSPLAAMQLILSKKVSILKAFNLYNIIIKNYYKYIFVILLISFFIFSPLFYNISNLKVLFNTSDSLSIVLLILIVLFTSFACLNNSYMQGNQNFKLLSIISITNISLKIIICSFLVYFGYHLNGALFGVTLSLIITIMIGSLFIINLFPKTCNENLKDVHKTDIFVILSIVAASVALSIMNQLDMVLVNWFFPKSDSGDYAAASTLGKAILYLPGGIIMVLYPMVSELHAKNISSSNILLQGVVITLIMGLGASFIYYFFSDNIINIIYGNNYINASKYLKWYGFAILPMSIILILENFFIAKNQLVFSWIFILVSPFQVLAIYLFHNSIYNILISIFVCSLLVLLIGMIYIFILYKNKGVL